MDNNSDEISPKHTIRDPEAFQKGREALGGIILKGMKITGGTDVDWLVEHNGGFIIIELKEIHDDIIVIPVGQMIAYERLYKTLNNSTKCYFLFVGSEEIDFKNPDSPMWYFEMKEWNDGTIPYTKSPYGKAYLVRKKSMQKTSVGSYRELLETFWRDLEKTD
jgi:hypothetical protein